jgi:LytS/YehU family sensor histidine kinase
MILQPLIENAIKHGVYESTDRVIIRLDASVAENILDIKITNNYDPESPAKKGAGMGLKNIQNRMLLIYNRSDLFRYKKEKELFIANLSIPIDPETE